MQYLLIFRVDDNVRFTSDKGWIVCIREVIIIDAELIIFGKVGLGTKFRIRAIASVVVDRINSFFFSTLFHEAIDLENGIVLLLILWHKSKFFALIQLAVLAWFYLILLCVTQSNTWLKLCSFDDLGCCQRLFVLKCIKCANFELICITKPISL